MSDYSRQKPFHISRLIIRYTIMHPLETACLLKEKTGVT